MPRSFVPVYYNNIDYVEVEDKTFSLYQNNECLMVLPKCAISAMITSYENILLDFENERGKGRKYWSDRKTIIYMKNILEFNGTSSRDTNVKVFCILQVPFEVNLSKEAFQSMIISAAISCRIDGDDSHRTRSGLEYDLSSSKSVIFHNSRKFSIYDDRIEEKIKMPVSALAHVIMHKKEILRDICDDDYFDEKVYWSNETFQIKSEYLKNFRVLCFVEDYKDNYSVYIRMRDRTFKTMIHIATGGPSWSKNMDDRMQEIREIYWNSIPINTVKRVEFSRDGRRFTLINEVNGDTLTLSVSALKAAQKYKRDILSDFRDRRFHSTYKRDYMNEYWTDDVYALRTGVFYNLYRSIDCNVVCFTRLKDNYYEFVLNQKAFLSLLEQ